MCKSLGQRGLCKGKAGTNLASLSLKFCDRSAARDAPGEEPRTDLLLKYSGLGSWKVNWPLPSGLGTRCGPKRLDWPKLEGGAGRIAASGEDVSMTLQDVGACTNAVVLLYGSGVCRRCRETVSTAGCSACSTEGEVACFEGREGRSSEEALRCMQGLRECRGDQVGVNQRRPPRLHLLRGVRVQKLSGCWART